MSLVEFRVANIGDRVACLPATATVHLLPFGRHTYFMDLINIRSMIVREMVEQGGEVVVRTALLVRDQ